MPSKKIILIVVIILLCFGLWFFISSLNSGSKNGVKQNNTLSSLFPFSNNSNIPPSNNSEQKTTNTGSGNSTPQSVQSDLIQISNKFIAGFTVLPPDPTSSLTTYDINGTKITNTKGNIPTVRFAERGTGYIFNVDAQGQNGNKVSGTVIARTALAFFLDNGNSVILRYIKNDNQTIATFLGKIIAPQSTLDNGTLKGDFLSDNILDLAISPDEKTVAYVLQNGDGVVGMQMKPDGTAKKQLFINSFSEWLLNESNSFATITTKADSTTPGFSYLVTTSGILQKLIGDINGLTTKISPDGKTLLYSQSTGNDVVLYIRNIKDNSDINTSLKTLPEKCIWSNDNINIYCGASTISVGASYPDDWYQGNINFSDSFWKINTKTGITTELNNGEGNNIDAINLAIDSKEQFLFFMDKNNNSLWSLNLSPKKVSTPPAPTLPNTN